MANGGRNHGGGRGRDGLRNGGSDQGFAMGGGGGGGGENIK